MGINDIVVSLPDTIAISSTSKGVVLHSCPSSTTVEDIWLTVVIGLIIIGGLLIIGYYASKIVSSVQKAKDTELTSRQQHERDKLQKENDWNEKKYIYDSAWRIVEHSWKEPKDYKERQQLDSAVDKALAQIKGLWKMEIPAKNSDNEKNGQTES